MPTSKKILSSVGVEFDGDRIKKIVGDLSGKNIEELIEVQTLFGNKKEKTPFLN